MLLASSPELLRVLVAARNVGLIVYRAVLEFRSSGPGSQDRRTIGALCPIASLVPSNLVVALAKLQIGDSRPGAILFRRFLSNKTNSGRVRCA